MPKKPKRKRDLTTIALPMSLCKKIDRVVGESEDGFVSRSDFVRHAIRMTIRDYESV